MKTYGILAAMLLTGTCLSMKVAHAADDATPAEPKWTGPQLEKGYVVFEYGIMANLPPTHVPAGASLVTGVSRDVARGEYESLQVGVHALAGDLKDIRVSVESDLEVTVYHRISPAVKDKLASDPGGIARWMASEVYLQRGDVVGKLAAGRSVNFWLTFRAERDATAGVHEGTIRIAPAGKPATVLKLQVNVRPFELQAPRVPFGMFYREDFLPKRFGSWGIADKTALAFYRDMAVHGQNSVSLFMGGRFDTLPPTHSRTLTKCLPLAKQAGLVHPDLSCVMLQGNISSLTDDQRKRAVAWLQAECRKQGWPEIIE